MLTVYWMNKDFEEPVSDWPTHIIIDEEGWVYGGETLPIELENPIERLSFGILTDFSDYIDEKHQPEEM